MKTVPVLFMLLIFTSCGRLLIEWPEGPVSSLPEAPSVISVSRLFGPIRFPVASFTASADNSMVNIIRRGSLVYLVSTALTNSGGFTISLNVDGTSYKRQLIMQMSGSDADRDGYPDAAELGRLADNFRDWFCMIAESQFYAPSDSWYDVHKDCAGLLEFCYREALKRHDSAWARAYRFLPDYSYSDSRPFYYPAVPFIENRIFRVTPGVFSMDTVTRDFAGAAGGTALRDHSMRLIGRDLAEARKGDMIFFFHGDNLAMPSHGMIYMGRPAGGTVSDAYFLYHTGPDGNARGFMKKVRAAELMAHPDTSWRPVPENTAFTGVYRWKILD